MEKIERHFDDELKKLNSQLLKMATMVEEAIHNSIEALKNQDAKLAQSVIDDDRKIDEMELAIEESAIELLALRQPMARDLRFIITTGMKLNAELERMADLAVNISRKVIEVSNMPLLKPLINIPNMFAITRKMIKNAIDAYVNRDENLAKDVIIADPEADRLRDEIYDELINEYMVKDGSTTPRAVPLILITTHLERICDHATNIAEDVIYMVNAQVVKHHPEKLENDENV